MARSDLESCYHFIKVTIERARTNAIGHPLSLDLCAGAGFSVRQVDLSGVADDPCPAGTEAPTAPVSLRRTVPALRKSRRDAEVVGCLDGLPMGDHGAVDFVQAGHGALLTASGLLGDRELNGGSPGASR